MKTKKKQVEWLTRNAIADRMGIPLTSVQNAAKRPDAPAGKMQGNRMVFPWPEMEAYVQSVSKWGAGLPQDARTMKDEMIKLDLEAKREAAAVRRGELVNKKSVADAIAALGGELFAMIKNKFVDELPYKYLGKNEVECRFLNETAFNEISVAFRTGANRVEGK